MFIEKAKEIEKSAWKNFKETQKIET